MNRSTTLLSLLVLAIINTVDCRYYNLHPLSSNNIKTDTVSSNNQTNLTIWANPALFGMYITT